MQLQLLRLNYMVHLSVFVRCRGLERYYRWVSVFDQNSNDGPLKIHQMTLFHTTDNSSPGTCEGKRKKQKFGTGVFGSRRLFVLFWIMQIPDLLQIYDLINL